MGKLSYKYHEIDNNIIQSDTTISGINYKYENAANTYRVRFTDNMANDYQVNLEYQGKSISYGLADASVFAKASVAHFNNIKLAEMIAESPNSVVYTNVYPGIDLIYKSKTSELKEYIVINQPTDKNEFLFNLNLNGVTITQNEGSLDFVDRDNNIVFSIGELYAFDYYEAQTNDISYTVIENNGTYQIKIIIDKSFLCSEDRVYPIVIDPSVMITGTGVSDAFVGSRYPTTNYGTDDYERTGYSSGYYVRRSYIDFPLPTNIPAGYVTSA